MRALRPILREFALAFYRWAQREIDPTHRDMPHIVLTLHRLEEERRTA